MTCPLAGRCPLYRMFLEEGSEINIESCKYDYESCKYYLACQEACDPEKCIKELYMSKW